MPSFATPQPIAITVEVFLGDVKIIATDRTDTVVTVSPSDPAKNEDARAAQDTTVDYAAGTLTVRAPRDWRLYTPFSGNASIDVTIEAPRGSRLHGTGSVARFLTTGELGQVELKTSVGDMQVEQAGPIELKTSGGNITLDRATQRATIHTSTGLVRVRALEGSATIKNSNGDSTVHDSAGDLQVNAANGNITIDRARGAVTAKTANGSIRIGDAANGTLQLETSAGEIEVGVHSGSAAWLDLNARHGMVQNLMNSTEQPAETEDTLEVYARNAFGNIIVRQATTV